MKYEELVEQVRKAIGNAIVSKNMGHLAFQFNVEGEGKGAFYIEIAEGKINVEPYEYYDRNLLIVTTADVIMEIIEGNIQLMEAYAHGKIKVYGSSDLLHVLPLGGKGKGK